MCPGPTSSETDIVFPEVTLTCINIYAYKCVNINIVIVIKIYMHKPTTKFRNDSTNSSKVVINEWRSKTGEYTSITK